MKKQYLFIYLFFLGVIILTSCSQEADYYPSVSGKADPSSIEKANLLNYFPFESKIYSIIKSYGIDSSKVAFGDSAKFVLGQRGYCFHGDTIKSHIQYNLLAANKFQNLKEFTISSWIQAPVAMDDREEQVIMINGGDTISGRGSLSISFDSQFMKGYLFTDSAKTQSYEIKIDRNLIKSNEWVHIAFIYNSMTSTMALYANGIMLKEDTCYANADTIPKIKTGALNLSRLKLTKLYIGAWPQQVSGTSSSFMKYFSGRIDEMRIWNKGLSKETINSLYKAELSQAINK